MTDRQILVVDDERSIRTTMARALEPLGLPVALAMNGEEALQKLGDSTFALVFLDLRMPGVDGIEVLRRINRQWPATRVVVISAHGTVGNAVEVMRLGAVDFLQKPFSPADVREVASSVLQREHLQEATTTDYRSLVEIAKRHISDRALEAASSCLKRAVAVDPGQPEAYNLLGALLEMRGAWLEAEKFYRVALDVDPTFKPARANLERAVSWDKRGPLDLGPEPDDDAPRHRPARGEG